MKDMKLIMENWRSYVETLEYTEPKVYLFEGKQKPTQKNLSSLFEDSKKGLMTEEQVLQAWRQSVLYESQQLINEGVMDALKVGWNAIKKGGEWLTEKTVAAYAWAMKKINDFINNIWGGINVALIRAVESAKANIYIQSVLEDLNSLKEKVLDFKSEHPAAFKVMVVMLATGALLLAMAAYSSDAHALIKDGKTIISTEELNGIKGVLQTACAEDPSVCVETRDAIKTLNDYASKAQASAGQGAGIDASEVLNLAKRSSDETTQIIKTASRWWDQVQETVREYATEVKAEIKPTIDAMNADPSSVTTGQMRDVTEKMQEVKTMLDDLGQIAQTGEESTFRTLQRIVSKGEGSFSSSTRMGGVLPKPPSGLSTWGEPLAKAIKGITAKGQ